MADQTNIVLRRNPDTFEPAGFPVRKQTVEEVVPVAPIHEAEQTLQHAEKELKAVDPPSLEVSASQESHVQ